MGFVAEMRDGDVRQARVLPAVFGLAGPGIPDRPAGVGVFLRRPRRIVGPYLISRLSGAGPRLLLFRHPLTRSRDQARIDDLSARRPVAPIPKARFKGSEQCLKCARKGRSFSRNSQIVF